MKQRLLVIQHTPVEGLGRLEGILRREQIDVQWIRPDAAVSPADLQGVSGVVVLGGPMGVYELDRHPRLADEKRLIEAALRSELPLLGICLGSQLLASVLGSDVRPGPQKELGWYDVMCEPDAAHDALFSQLPPRFAALHWHGDIFELPKAAVPLARSALTQRQAFRYGPNAYGLLFHLEADAAQVRAMCHAFADEVAAVSSSAELLSAQTAQHEPAVSAHAEPLFSAFLRML